MVRLLSLILTLIYTSSTFAGNITPINSDALKTILLKQNTEKFIFFFTSWCMYCKPFTLSNDLPRDKIIFVAIDENVSALEKFMPSMSYDVYHIIPTQNYSNLIQLSKDLNIKFATLNQNNELSWGVPYIIHINQNNKAITDNISVEDFSKLIK